MPHDCDCAEREWAINPRRECSKCAGFIDFYDIADFLEWSDSLKRVDRRERSHAELPDAAE